MTADAKQVADLATVAADRDQLLALLADAESAKQGAKSGAKWSVVQQHQIGALIEVPLCRHRFEWAADLCVWRRTRRHAHEAGGHYTARRADA